MILTPTEIAEKLKVSEWWVTEQCRTERLSAYKIAGKWRIEQEDYDAWLESLRHTPDIGTSPAVKTSTEPKGDQRISLADVRAHAA